MREGQDPNVNDGVWRRGVVSTLLRQAGWAPVAVLVFHWIGARTALRVALDNVNHFLGGAAMAYFMLHAIRLTLPGRLPATAAHGFAFALTCTVAVFWEILEFVLDQIRGTHIQSSIPETMYDLIFGAFGAVVALAALALLARTRPAVNGSE